MGVISNTVPLNWKIITEDQALSASEASFQDKNSAGMVPYRVPVQDLDFVTETFLGYSYRSNGLGGGGSSMRRVKPQPHPFWPGLWADRVQVQGEVSPEPGRNDFKGIKIGVYDRYAEYRVNVFYRKLPYVMKEDNEVTKEQQRWVEKLPSQPHSEVLSIQGGQLKFTTRAGVAVTDGVTIANDESLRIGKSTIKWIWHQVPVNWVLDSNKFAANIEARIGTINLDAWEGYGAETLYLDSAPISYVDAAVSNQRLDLNVNEPAQYVEVELNFKYFREGWNKLLYPGRRTWDAVEFVNNGVLTGRKLYDKTDFDGLFEVVA